MCILLNIIKYTFKNWSKMRFYTHRATGACGANGHCSPSRAKVNLVRVMRRDLAARLCRYSPALSALRACRASIRYGSGVG